MKIASIVVTFNPEIADLENVFASHDQTEAAGLVLIDNGSANQQQILACAQSRLKSIALFWIPIDDNVGLAKALNMGILCAEKNGFTHVILFDQDTIVPKTLVNELARQFLSLTSQGARVGAIGPTYVDPRTNSEYPQCIIRGALLKKVWPSASDNESMEVSFIITSGSFFSIDAVRDIGWMREDFFIDCVDIEWCFRARHKGYKIFCTKTAAMLHTIGDRRVRSLGRDVSIHSPKRRYYMARNSIYLIRLPTVPLVYRARQVVMTFFRVPLFLWSVKFSPIYIKSIFFGIVDGVFTRLNKAE